MWTKLLPKAAGGGQNFCRRQGSSMPQTQAGRSVGARAHPTNATLCCHQQRSPAYKRAALHHSIQHLALCSFFNSTEANKSGRASAAPRVLPAPE